jgi:hypothetical protein
VQGSAAALHPIFGLLLNFMEAMYEKNWRKIREKSDAID